MKELAVQKNIVSREVFESFINYIDVAPLTQRSYLSGLKIFSEYLASFHIKTPTRDDVVNFKKALEGKKRKPATIALYLSALRRFFSWTEQIGFYPNITTGVKAPKISKNHKKDCFSASQIKSILKNINRDGVEGARNYAIMALMATCGLRTVEVVRAKIEDLQTLTGVSVLYIQGKGRSEKSDFVKIPVEVENAIKEYLKLRGKIGETEPLFTSESKRNHGQKLTTRTISSIAKSAMVNAGFKSNRLTAHSLRHTAVTLSLLAGNSLEDVQAFARHSSINTTMIYNHSVNRLKSLCENSIAKEIF